MENGDTFASGLVFNETDHKNLLKRYFKSASPVTKHFIGGKWMGGGSKKTLPIFNPATGQVIAHSPEADDALVHKAVTAAKKAHHDWWKKPAVEKAALFHRLAQRIRDEEQDLAHCISLDTGKPLIESKDCIDWVAAAFDYYAEVARSSYGLSLPPVAPHQINFTIKEPYGVVAAIVPFNFPLLLMSWKAAAALMAGNTMVIKPPHQNPLSNLLMARLYEEVLPPGVVSVITGGARTGELLVNHPDVDLVAFTGSTAVGRKIASQCGQNLKKINLELGGIDPLIVFSDANLKAAVHGAAWARLLNAGQVCTSSKRFYVVKKVYDKFMQGLLDHVKTLQMGDPFLPSTDIGPVIAKSAVNKLDSQLMRLKKEGAKLLYRSELDLPRANAKGFFYPVHIFENVKHGGLASTEEVFGPVINVIRVADDDEAIAKANDSQFGLGAVVYTESLKTAMHAMENIKAGTFWINDPLTDNDAGPFGGMRFSGVGRELGEEGLNAFREPKHVHLDYVSEVKSFWFPNAQRPPHFHKK